MNEPTLEQVRQRFTADCFASKMGTVIEDIKEGYARCTLDITPRHLNAAGAVMGGAIFTLADFAFAVAANWNQPRIHVSLTSQITYLGEARGQKLIAEARIAKEGRSTCYCLVDVTDELGHAVAQLTESGFVKG